LPHALALLPLLGFVRNPWSYYVSWYAFQVSQRRQNALFNTLSEDGRLDFAGTIHNMVSLANDEERLQAVVKALPATYTNRGLNLPGFALAPIAGTGLGFYSYLSQYMFEGSGPAHIGRMETLPEDLPRLLGEVGEPVSAALQEHLRSAAPSNASTHGPYQGYYTSELRQLVEERDATIIQRFGYRFVQ
jgi:hypothetical protein